MNIKEKLVEARNILANDGWCQGRLAKDINGSVTQVSNPGACKFCMRGVLGKVTDHKPYGRQADQLARALINHLPSGTIPYFNDCATLPEVLEVFDKAIAAQE